MKAGAQPAFLGYRGYPATLCISVNEEVVHGIPGKRKLEGRRHRRPRPRAASWTASTATPRARSAVGRVSDGGAAADAGDARSRCTRASRSATPASASATSATPCRAHAEGHGYSVVREFVGHGIGTSLHEEPQVPNYGPPGRRERLVPGMCLAIEPMVNVGRARGAACSTTAGRRSPRTAACPPTSSCRWRSREQGPWILSEPYPVRGGTAGACLRRRAGRAGGRRAGCVEALPNALFRVELRDGGAARR